MKIGILGNGQLGQMLKASIQDINDIEVDLYDLRNHTPQALNEFIANQERLGFETENISAEIVEILENYTDKLYPPLDSLKTFQHRIKEKQALQQAKIKTAKFKAVNSLDDIFLAIDEFGLPLILKTTTEGYDGKGQFFLKSRQQAIEAWEAIGKRELIAESFVHFERELSIIACRDTQGKIKVWPMTENIHHEGILRCSVFPPSHLSEAMQAQAHNYIIDLANSQNYIGTITLELFATTEGLVANEVAPRVHNSGHWSIEGAQSSQFRNHMLAMAGLPIEEVQAKYPACAMLNLIGSEKAIKQSPPNPQVFVHSYHKEARKNRKLGHVTLVSNSIQERDTLIEQYHFLLPKN